MKRRFSIQIIFTSIIAGIVSLCIIGIGIFTWVSINNSWHTQTELYIKQLTKRYMREVMAIMQNVYDTNKALSDSYTASEHIPAGNRRNYFLQLQQDILKKNKTYIDVWTVMEPNALDGLDVQYKNTENHDSSGRFIPYFTQIDGTRACSR